MLKKTFLVIFSCILIITSVACSNKKNEESVSIKESETSLMYKLEETNLLQPVEFKKDGISVVFDTVLYVENLTRFSFNIKNETEKVYKILVTDLSINGIMYHSFMENTLESKTAKTAYFDISNEWLYTSFIEMIKDIEFTVRILDENSSEIASSDILEAKTNASAKYVQKYDKTGTCIFENSEALILFKGLKKSKYSDDSELGFFIENNTDSHISVIADEVFINEKMFTPTFIVSVGANKKASESMLLTKEALDAANIDNITSVKVSFKAIDKGSNTVFKTSLADIPLK